MNPILVALDLDSTEEAVGLAGRLAPHVGGFKVGLQLLIGAGPAVLSEVIALGKPVFADAKLHDIPAVVGRAARQLGLLGARWVSVHAMGGRAMLEAAAQGLAESLGGRRGGMLAVTVLTSLDDRQLAEIGLAGAQELTFKLASLAQATGCEGVVCSPRELEVVAAVADGLLRVTPGIRPAGASIDDQARVSDPEAALRHGADLLVVGRPITAAPDPVAAVVALKERLGSAGGRAEG